MEKKQNSDNQIIIYKTKNGQADLQVNLREENIWLSQKQIGELFNTERSVITKHINSIFQDKEVEEKSNVQKMHIPNSDKPVKFYGLDIILAIGYKVNTAKGIHFRRWATKTLKNHILKGYTFNQKRLGQIQGKNLKEFEKTIALIKKTITQKKLTGDEAEGLLNVITDYANSWALLLKYDEEKLEVSKTHKNKYLLDYAKSQTAITELKNNLIAKKEASELFGAEREKGLQSILGNLNQSFSGQEIYPSIEEKASHLLYFVIKNHPFVDGNKRIGSLLFILFLAKNKALINKKGDKKINDNALVALALLVAESAPKQKEIIIRLIMNFIN